MLIERQKKAFKINGPRTLSTKIIFGYRVVHHLDTV